MNLVQRVLLCVFITAISAGCANYKVHVADSGDDLTQFDVKLLHTVYFVGDAGEETNIQKRNLQLLRRLGEDAPVKVSCIFLGDNIYPLGMPKKDSGVQRDIAESTMNSQMEVLAGIADDVVFIGGNHDWAKGKPGGLAAMKRQDKYVKSADLDGVRVKPDDGCPGPEFIEIGESAVIVLIDSQWWLQDWSTEKDINDKCGIRSRFGFLSDLSNELNDYKEKQVIIAAHHPPISSGSHGGYFTFSDHVFPLTKLNKYLYVPLPVIGSIYPVYRSTFGNVQDQPHPKYREYIEALEVATEGHDNVIIVSGHEHALEYHEDDGRHYVVSGSGSRISPVASPVTQKYGHGAGGFVQMDIYERGGVEIHFWEPDENGNADKPTYSSKIVEPKRSIEEIVQDIPVEPLNDSIETVVSESYAKGNTYQFLFGERYRTLYKVPVKAKVINLKEEHGGLIPVKKGGGFQTNSLRLENAEGRQYVLRSLNKDATRLLPEIFQSTFATDILQDQFTASHPYAAFAIPPLADAARIYHTNPELVFLASQQQLGKYNNTFQEALYLYEERPDDDWSDAPYFGYSENIEGYDDILEEDIDEYTNQVDQRFVLRSRLFDMFIGDWDRHDDQWRWATIESPDHVRTIFRPIPRDRDQAFSDYDGFLVTMANWYTPSLRKMSRFQGDIKRIKWFNFNARHFDRDFLNALPKEVWIEESERMKEAITDEVIDEGLGELPPEIYAIQGDEIRDILRERRDRIPEFALEYYDELYKRVYVKGSDDADFFEIERFDGYTVVSVFDSNKEGDKNVLYYRRTFQDDETEAIEVYGLDGHDHFEVTGNGKTRIKVYLVGGLSRDEFVVAEGAKSKRVRAFDTHNKKRTEGMKYERVSAEENTYERKSFEYNYSIPLIKLGWNPDDGFLLGGGVQFVNYGFKKLPFASRHSVSAAISLGSGSFFIDYFGEWKHVLGKAGVDIDAHYQTQSYVENFFGFGNDTEQEVDDLEYYRTRKRSIRFLPAIVYGGDQGHRVRINVGAESHRVEETEDRFVTEPGNGLPEDVFDDRRFAMFRADYSFVSTENDVITTRGIRFNLSGGVDHEWQKSETHRYIESSLALYFEIQGLGKPVIATRIGGASHWGDLQFYQTARLGALNNFRGMPNFRLSGNKSFYQNIDLRINLAKWRNYYLPAQMGLVLSFDHGRVWLDNEDSDTWHYSYGGALWVSPFQTLLLSLGYYVSDLDQRFDFRMGFFF